MSFREYITHSNTTPFYNLGIFLSGLFLVHRKVFRDISLADGQSLLDVGCGTGLLLSLFAKKYGSGVALLGVDTDSEKIGRAKEKFSERGIRFKVASADDLPATNNSHDVVVSTLTAHHLTPAVKKKMAGECARVLKPGGLFYCADFGRPKGLIGHVFSFLVRRHAHTEDNMDALEEALGSAGLVKISSQTQFGFIEHLVAKKLLLQEGNSR